MAAPGIARFQVIPEWVPASLPEDGWSHTSPLVRFDHLRGARVAIVGGRQSAFAWAALLADAGAPAVRVPHRHDAPSVETSQWGFVDALRESTVRISGWFRRLAAALPPPSARRSRGGSRPRAG